MLPSTRPSLVCSRLKGGHRLGYGSNSPPSPGNGVSDDQLDCRFCCLLVIFISSLKLPFFYYVKSIMLRKRAKGLEGYGDRSLKYIT